MLWIRYLKQALDSALLSLRILSLQITYVYIYSTDMFICTIITRHCYWIENELLMSRGIDLILMLFQEWQVLRVARHSLDARVTFMYVSWQSVPPQSNCYYIYIFIRQKGSRNKWKKHQAIYFFLLSSFCYQWLWSLLKPTRVAGVWRSSASVCACLSAR